jgi:hypothetical protein
MRDFSLADDRNGSKASFWPGLANVRSSSKSGAKADIPEPPLAANNRHSRAHSKTLSARVRIGSVMLRPICASALSA